MLVITVFRMAPAMIQTDTKRQEAKLITTNLWVGAGRSRVGQGYVKARGMSIWILSRMDIFIIKKVYSEYILSIIQGPFKRSIIVQWFLSRCVC